MHGKCLCDSAGKIPKLIVQSGAMSGDVLRPGTKALVRYLAKSDNFIPPDLQNNTVKSGTLTGHTYVYIPEEYLRKNMKFARARGSKHSSLIHQFGSTGDGSLLTRAKWCACTPCLKSHTLFADDPGSKHLNCKDFRNIKSTKCEMASIVGLPVTQIPIPEFAAINSKSSKRQTSSSSLDMSKTKFYDDATFAKSLSVNDRVLTYINPADRLTQAKDGEAYFVATISRGPPWQIANDGTFGGGEYTNLFKKGEWVVWIKWMRLVKIDGRDNRLYQNLAGSEQVISVRSFLRTGISGFKMHYNTRTRCYMITESDHANIMKFTEGLEEVSPQERQASKTLPSQ